MDLVLGSLEGTVIAAGGVPPSRRAAPSRLHPALFPKCPCLYPQPPRSPLVARSRKRGTPVEPAQIEADGDHEDEEGYGEDEVAAEDSIEDLGDEILSDHDEVFEDDFELEDNKLYIGDGAAGGGISLAGTSWDKKALNMAEEVSTSFGGDLKIYAFKTTLNCIIRVRIEKLSRKFGSPSMSDIEAFTSAYQERLDEAERAGDIPGNISLEVSSPGVERVVRIPEELERFKEKPMYVRYTINDTAATSPQESEGVFRLVSFDLESCHCTWGIADVKVNRKQAGKGRPLSKKQKEWRLQTPFDSLLLVRLHSDC